VCDSDTLTDVSSLHDADNDDVSDEASQCTRAVTDLSGTSDTAAAADNFSDLTIPDFTVSSPLHFSSFLCCYHRSMSESQRSAVMPVAM